MKRNHLRPLGEKAECSHSRTEQLNIALRWRQHPLSIRFRSAEKTE